MESGRKSAGSGRSGECVCGCTVTRGLEKGTKGSRSLRVGIPEAKNRSVPQERFWALPAPLGLHTLVFPISGPKSLLTAQPPLRPPSLLPPPIPQGGTNTLDI